MAARYTLGVIGVGNMGGALVRRIVSVGALDPNSIIVSDADAERSAALAADTGVGRAGANAECAREAEYVALVVKPGLVREVVSEIADVMTPQQTLVSMAAGIPLRAIESCLGEAEPALVRVMPNTPALVGAGVFAITGPGVPLERLSALESLLAAAGGVVHVGESLMDAVTGLSGSGPAFVFVMIEALADGGVAAGLPRAVAHRLAVDTVAGAAKLVQETGEHPGELKDAVASPAGTTIAGLSVLEAGGFRGLVASAVRAAAERSRELSEGG
jgi:pyrroline-5-carboxylate reductase